jgi:hypothetical protein
MRLFVIADTELIVPRSLVLAKIQDMIHCCAQNMDAQVIVVGDAFPEAFYVFCNNYNSVKLQSQKEAANFIKEVTNASILHFGTTCKWGNGCPTYFMPLTIPNEMVGLSFLKRFLLNRKFNKWINKSVKLLSSNHWSLKSVQFHFPEYNPHFQTVGLPTLEAANFEWQQLSAAKEKLTDGNNYFLAFAPVERFTAILKEFSVFKKWQQTSMHLVFVFETKKEVASALEQLKGYKFRNDISIHFVDDVCLEWIAATYAILWEGINFSKSTWVEYAIQYDIPLLFDAQINLPENWLKAGEVFSFTEKLALSNHFKLYYKDEIYRQARARMGKEWLQLLNQGTAGKELFNKIVLSHII